MPHIPRQSKPAQAGLSPTHYPSRRSLGRDLLAHLAAAWRFAQARLLRTSVGGSSAVAEARFGVETAGTSSVGGSSAVAEARFGVESADTSTWCGAGLGLGFGLGIGMGFGLGVGWFQLTARPGIGQGLGYGVPLG